MEEKERKKELGICSDEVCLRKVIEKIVDYLAMKIFFYTEMFMVFYLSWIEENEERNLWSCVLIYLFIHEEPPLLWYYTVSTS